MKSGTIKLRLANMKDREDLKVLLQRNHPEVTTDAQEDKPPEGMTRSELFVPYYFPEKLIKGRRFFDTVEETLSK